jgi:hypothetical protein
MKAEGETPYEPHILLRLETIKNLKTRDAIITAFAEKDRTGVLAGQTIAWPDFNNIVKPLLPLLGKTQAHIQDEDETSRQDAERFTADEKKQIHDSEIMLGRFQARFKLCETAEDLRQISKEITPELKKRMTSSDVASLRESYLEAELLLKGQHKAPEPPHETKAPEVATQGQGEGEVPPEGGTDDQGPGTFGEERC